jgi:tetratricopeptide (TPR) repeat protein
MRPLAKLRLVLPLLAISVALHAQGNRASIRDLETAVQADSNDPAAHFQAASAYFKAKRYADAERALRQAVRIDPQYAPALYLLARTNVMLAPGSLALVMDEQRRIMFVRLDPRADENMLLRRRAFLIDPLLEIGPPDRNMLPVVWRGTLGLALHHYDRQEWNEAVAGFQQVIDRTTKPRDSTRVPPVALWFRARCALQLGDFDGAIRHLQWLLSLRMQDSTRERVWNPFAGEELRYIIAYVHQQARRWDDAVVRYQELVEHDLGLDAAHTHIAEIYEAQERWPEAVTERVRAVQANPDATSLLFNLGSTLTMSGRYQEAQAVLERYNAAYPREARVHYMLGIGAIALGDTTRARDAFNRYLSMAPRRYEAQIADARRRLAALAP